MAETHRATREAVLRFPRLLHHRLYLVVRVAVRVVAKECGGAKCSEEQCIANAGNYSACRARCKLRS